MIGGGELAHDRKTLFVGGQRASSVASGKPRVAGLVETDAQVVLPPRIARVGAGELARDPQALFLRGERP